MTRFTPALGKTLREFCGSEKGLICRMVSVVCAPRPALAGALIKTLRASRPHFSNRVPALFNLTDSPPHDMSDPEPIDLSQLQHLNLAPDWVGDLQKR